MHRVSLLLLAAALTLFGATSTKTTAPAGKTVAANDSFIESIIRTKLSKSKIGADNFKFRVQGGVVYWDGKTEVPQHKGAATRMAKTAGAVRVVNNIQVSEAAKAKARARFEHSHRSEPRSEPRSAVVRR